MSFFVNFTQPLHILASLFFNLAFVFPNYGYFFTFLLQQIWQELNKHCPLLMWLELYNCNGFTSIYSGKLRVYGPLSSWLYLCLSHKRVKRYLGYLLFPCFNQKWEMRYRLRNAHVFHSADLTYLCYLPVLKAFELVIPRRQTFCEFFKVTTNSSDKLISVNMRLGTLFFFHLFNRVCSFHFSSCLSSKSVVLSTTDGLTISQTSGILVKRIDFLHFSFKYWLIWPRWLYTKLFLSNFSRWISWTVMFSNQEQGQLCIERYFKVRYFRSGRKLGDTIWRQ